VSDALSGYQGVRAQVKTTVVGIYLETLRLIQLFTLERKIKMNKNKLIHNSINFNLVSQRVNASHCLQEAGEDEDASKILNDLAIDILTNAGLDIKELIHYKETTKGLWATDKEPKQNKKNFFQLT
jgi:hypothetical protein